MKSAKKSKPGHRERRSASRLWLVVYPLDDRMDAREPAGVFISTSDLVPLPVAFIPNSGRDAVRLALRIIRGKASFDEATDYRGCNWMMVGSRMNNAILYPLDSTGKPDVSVDHLAAARVFIDPLDHSVRFITFDVKGLATYLSTQKMLGWSIPRAIGKGMVELAI
ncbi:MAG TPA: hypothetical protein VHX86_17155 [Tepidisphaeraceae bacterium]|jgi:hypothetical protein|nr:hypothetical protein [Tepidisphaeraceae bacterium]